MIQSDKSNNSFNHLQISNMVNVLKFRTLLCLFTNKTLVICRTGIHKILVKIANREDPDRQGYGILCSKFLLLLGPFNIEEINYGDICQFIRDTCLFTSRDMGYHLH